MKTWCTSEKWKGKGQHRFLACKIFLSTVSGSICFERLMWGLEPNRYIYKANEHLQNWKVCQKKLLSEKYVDQKPISSLPALEIQRPLSSCQKNGWWELAKEGHRLLLEKILHNCAWHVCLGLPGSRRDRLNCTLSVDHNYYEYS